MQWYEELFTNFAESYDNQVFVKGTIGEVDFIEKEINHNKSFQIIDIGCGTGRHSIELALRGYKVTGIDLSDSQLAKANLKAKETGVNINFLKKDARNFSFPNPFDFAMMICEGAFPLMETDEMNFMILQNAYNALKQNGKFIFTTLNGLFPLFHSVKDFINKNSGGDETSENTFDLMTFREYSIYETADDDGNKKSLKCNERYYVPSEITWLLKSIGFKNISIFGCEIGNFCRDKKLTTEDYEMLVICEK
ncbi:MAG: class I SAM-dependent methyltransferase [Ignavibacteriales bacterium]|nr:class I SAM-dependent methyltransferase [Ignavibacteriales bacterium]